MVRIKKDDCPALGKVYHLYKERAKKKGRSFELTKEQFKNVTSGRCVYCGASPTQATTRSGETYYYNGIDRADNDKGYTLANSVSCCGQCNRIKAKRSVKEFLDMVEKIARNIDSTKTLE